jgi:phospholipid transport system substrate-binding protein
MTNHPTRITGILLLVFSACVVPGAWAGAPTDQLRDGVDRVLKILRDPAMAGDANAVQRRSAILRAAGDIFDFGEMAKRSLGQHWAARTPAEHTQFVALFTELVQQSYLSKVDQHGGAKIIFGGETVDGDHAIVQTKVPLTNGNEMPLDYKLHKMDDRWQVYDLSLDGISLVSNYRAQFNKIIRIDSYEVLVARLRSHQNEFSTPAAAPLGKAAR